MRLARLAVAACVAVVVLAGTLAAQKEDKVGEANKEKLVGTWEAVKSGLPKGTLVKFFKDGKLIITLREKDQTADLEGKFSVEGNSIKYSYEAEKEVKGTLKIKKLSAKDLVTIDKDGREEEYKRKDEPKKK